MACECGCGGVPNKGRRWINGHQRRGRPHTSATLAKLRASFGSHKYSPKPCVVCSKTFAPDYARRDVCGSECKQTRKTLVRRAWVDTPQGRASHEASVRSRRASYAANPQSIRDQALWKNYGITRMEWRVMYGQQEGRCAICCEVLDRGKKTHVDHDHKSGKVRGLLCGHCNVAIGMLNENPSLMRAAAAYIEHHRPILAIA